MPRKSAASARPFDPAFDEQLAADLLPEQLRGTDAVVHPAAAERGQRQAAQHSLVGEQLASVSTIAGGWLSNRCTFAPQSAASRAGSEMHET